MKSTLDKAFGYQGDPMNLPVKNLDAALPFYEATLGFRLVSRATAPQRAAILARDQVQIGLAENGGDPTQDGCAFHVTGLEALLAELSANSFEKKPSDIKIEKRGDSDWKVFYVVAPDGLCYWFGERK